MWPGCTSCIYNVSMCFGPLVYSGLQSSYNVWYENAVRKRSMGTQPLASGVPSMKLRELKHPSHLWHNPQDQYLSDK